MAINIEPTQQQKDAMEKFARVVEQAIEMIMEYESGFSSTQAIVKANEASHWFNSMIINGAKKSAKESELIQNEHIIPYQSLN